MSSESLNSQKACEYVLDLLKKASVEGEVIVDSSLDFSLKAQKGKLSEVVASSTQVLGLRLMSAQRTAVASSESFTKASLAQMVEDATALAKLSRAVPENELTALKEKIEWDNQLTAPTDVATLEQKGELALSLEANVLSKDSSVKSSPYNGYSETERERFIANSNGLNVSYKVNNKSCYTSALIEKDGDQAMSYWSSVGRKVSELDAKLCINQSFERAQALIGAKSVPTGKFDVIFETNILQSFWSLFSNIFSAKATIQGLNPFEEKVKTQIASKLLSIYDRPHVALGLRSKFYDDEGNPCHDVTLIENGVLTSFIHNHQTALKLGQANNHRASRGAKSHLDVGHTHFCIAKGPHTERDLFNVPKLIVVSSIQGLSSGSSNISGDFSCGASGALYENGRFVRMVKGITMSGNWWQMLSSQLAALGQEQEVSQSRSFFSPLIRWSDIQIAGE